MIIHYGANFIINAIMYGLLCVAWTIFISGPLWIIELLMKPNGIFDYLSTGGLTDLLFGKVNPHTLVPDSVPRFFEIFALLAGFVIVLMFIVQLIMIQFTETHTIREKLGKAVKNSCVGTIVIICIPFFFTMLNYLMTGLMEILNTDIHGKKTLADYIWAVGAPNSSEQQPAGNKFGAPSDILDWNFLVELIGVWFTLYVLFLAAMVLVERIIDLILLLSISPLVAAMMPVDQGKRLGVWKEMVIGKFIIGPGTLLPIYIFIQLLPKVMDNAATIFKDDWLSRQLLYALFCTAGAVSCLKTQKLITHLVTQNLGVQGAIDSNGGNIAGSIMGKVRGIGGLASGGVSAAKFGMSTLFGSSKTDPNGNKVRTSEGIIPGAAKGLFKHMGRITGAAQSSSGKWSTMGNVLGEGMGLYPTGRTIRDAAVNGFSGIGSSLGQAFTAGKNTTNPQATPNTPPAAANSPVSGNTGAGGTNNP